MGRMLLLVAVGVAGLLMAGGVEGKGMQSDRSNMPPVEVCVVCLVAAQPPRAHPVFIAAYAIQWGSAVRPPCVQQLNGAVPSSLVARAAAARVASAQPCGRPSLLPQFLYGDAATRGTMRESDAMLAR